MARSRQPECGEPRCAKLAADVWPCMRQEGATWEQRRRLECGRCQDERARRARVMLTEQDRRHESPAFLAAPYVHPYNAPKYHAQQRRAMNFAQATHKCLLWVVAWDSPQNQEDKALKGDALQKARERWLQFHDQQTSGIMGLLPLVKDMPIRFTDTVDREKGMFKNSRGILTGWTLQPLDAQRIRGEDAAEMVLSERPLFLFVRIPGVRWTMSETLGENIYPVKPAWKTWARDRAQQAKVRRCGFPIVPDFSGTAHSYTGAT